MPRPTATRAPAPRALAERARLALRTPENWRELVRFVVVGGSGYLLNVAVFAAAVGFGLHHLVAATLAFLVAVSNNFWWNRHWTFRASAGRADHQAARYLTVSLTAFLLAALVLDVLVRSGLPEVPAQALSVGLATPLNFLGNKMWSFRTR